MEEKINSLYNYIADYATDKQMYSVTKALQILRDSMGNRVNTEAGETRYLEELLHSLEVCTMLIDLHMEISYEEKEALFAAALLHVYPENYAIEDLEETLVKEMGFSRQVYEIIDTIIPGRDLSDEELRAFYDRVQKNKLALLIVLADRGNIVERLYRFSSWNAHRYIEETKAVFYPMCVYGKEYYFELNASISVLLEKMRSLIELAEIMLRRFEIRESELSQDILALREENATIRGIIAKYTSGE